MSVPKNIIFVTGNPVEDVNRKLIEMFFYNDFKGVTKINRDELEKVEQGWREVAAKIDKPCHKECTDGYCHRAYAGI